ncbi:LysR family transcriptional regulator (chromosome initiation inhibitor) [Pseudoclavibacter chungangensis]|nr:ArgP/LysG family DNA-binding transcriptional regulator [Pseudoclavibacter chungangensis]NYJ66578.1 LysR family transcriptional regulator (chromosome initiation inhibitor) [Pseudoclavibacter chungangensis]
MLPVTIEQLDTLDAVIREGSFERAARALRITPSAVSQRMKALEETVGRIVVRRSTPTAVTDAGATLLRYARQVRLLGEEARRELGGDEDGTGWTEVPIAVSAESLELWFLDLVDHLPADSRIALRLFRVDEHHTTEPLRDGSVFAAITVSPEAVQGCSVESLGVMPYVAVATPELVALAADEGIERVPVIDFDDADPLQRRFLKQLGARNPVTGYVLPTTAAFASGIRRGLGWGFMPATAVAEELADGRLAPILPGASVTVPLYLQRWNIASTVLDTVSEAVRRAAAAHLVTGSAHVPRPEDAGFAAGH